LEKIGQLSRLCEELMAKLHELQVQNKELESKLKAQELEMEKAIKNIKKYLELSDESRG